VIDALNGIVWRDDSQVVELTVSKFYSSRPRLELTAVEL
jgi:Holliday junction resolvase RusA-like endonuclease